MQELKPLRTIHLPNEPDLTWDMVEKKSKQLNMNLSEYTRQLYRRDLYHKKIKDYTVELFFGVILALQLFLIIILLAR